jgi:methyl-accepting chemotaxis protein
MKGQGGVSDEEEAEEEITDETMADRFKRMVKTAVDKCIKDLEGSFVSWKEGFSGVLEKMTDQTRELSEGFSSINPVVDSFQGIMDSFTTNIGKLSGEQVKMMEMFTEEIKNVQPMVGNLETITSSLAEERKLFLDHVDTWISNFDQAGEKSLGQMRDLCSSLGEERREFFSAMETERGQFTSAMKEERERFGDRTQQWMDAFDKSGQEFLGKLDERDEKQQENVQAIIQGLEKQRDAFNESVGVWLEKFDETGKNMFSATDSTLGKIDEISGLFTGISEKYEKTIQELNTTGEQLVSSHNTLKMAQEEINRLADNQEQLMSMFTQSFEQQVTSDTVFRDTLIGIRNGLDALHSPLEVLAKPKKIRLIEE